MSKVKETVTTKLEAWGAVAFALAIFAIVHSCATGGEPIIRITL